jgi:hypothetical protein
MSNPTQNPTLDRRAGDHSDEALRLAADNAAKVKGVWCRCKPDPLANERAAYYRARQGHGWACCDCLGIVQVG